MSPPARVLPVRRHWPAESQQRAGNGQAEDSRGVDAMDDTAVRKVESDYELSEAFDADWQWGWE